MRSMKLFGLTALAVLGLTAFIGGSSASADVLCKTGTSSSIVHCPVSDRYGVGTVIQAQHSGTGGTWYELGKSGVMVGCVGGAFSATVTSAGGVIGTPVKASVNQFSIEPCYSGSGPSGPVRQSSIIGKSLGSLRIESTWDGSAVVVPVNMTWSVSYNGAECIYDGAVVSTDPISNWMHLNGGNPASFSEHGTHALVAKNPSTATCPATLTMWENSWAIASPKPLWVSEE